MDRLETHSELERHLAVVRAAGLVAPPIDDLTAGDIYDRGLQHDVAALLSRRQMIRLLGAAGVGAGLLTIVGCSPSSLASGSASSAATSASSSSASASSSTAASAATCDPIPDETAGPFPGDGSNGPDMLSQSGIVRQDIRSSLGTSTTVAGGVPLTIRLAIQDTKNGCAALANAAVYLWHCDREGRYSLYSQGVTNENYLRGVQQAGSDGIVSFTSVFPACYQGRWPHIHFEVYPSLDKATDVGNKIATSQIALPMDVCDQVYATDGYNQSVSNLARVSLQSDNVFGDDGGVRELGTMGGSVANGLVADLAVPV